MIFYLELPNYSGINRFVEYDSNWTNPLNGFVYFPLIVSIDSIKHSLGVERSDCVFRLSNTDSVLGSSVRFSDLFQANRIEGERVDVYQFDPSTVTSTLIFSGVIYRKSFSQELVTLEAVDSFSLYSAFVSDPISQATWPDARPQAIGERPQITINLVEGMSALVVKDYKIGRSVEAIDRSLLTIELDDVSQLSTGAARIEREDVTITSIDSVANTITVTRSAPELHGNGARVLMSDTFQIAIDGSTNLLTTLERAFIENGQNDVIELPVPDNVGQVNNIQVASWNEPPFIPRPTGEILSQIVEFNQGTGTALTPDHAAGKAANYTEGNYAVLQGGATDYTLTLTVLEAYRRQGSIRRVLLQVDHSGDRANYSSNNVNVSAGLPPSVLSTVGVLTNTDDYHSDYLELVEKKGARTVNVIESTGGGAASATLLFSTVLTSNSGATANDTKIDTGAESSLIDGDAVTSIIANTSKAQFAGQIDFTAPVIPSSIDPSWELTGVRFKFRHGGATESGSFTGEILILTASPLAVIEGPGSFGQSGSVTEEVATMGAAHVWIVNGGAGRVVGEVMDLIYQIRALEGGPWELIEGFMEIDYVEAETVKPAASVSNQFDITSLIPDFSGIDNFVCQIVKDAANTDGLLIYRAAIIAIYDEEVDELPDDVFVDVQSALTGTQAEVIEELWTGASYANRSSGDLDTASFAQAVIDCAIYSGADYAGYFQDKSILDAMIELARAGRCLLSNYRGKLYLEYIQLAYLSVTTYSIDDASIVTPEIEIQSQDTLNETISNLTLKGNFSDRRGFQLVSSSTSSAPFTGNERDIEERLAKSATALALLAQSILARDASICNEFELIVLESFSEKRPGQRFKIDFGFFTTRVLEVKSSEYIPERLVYRLVVRTVVA